MYTEQEFRKLVNDALVEYEKENDSEFSSEGDHVDWQDVKYLLAEEMGGVFDYDAWEGEGFFIMYWSAKLDRSIVLDGDARIEWESHDDLAGQLWAYQKEAQELEAKITLS